VLARDCGDRLIVGAGETNVDMNIKSHVLHYHPVRFLFALILLTPLSARAAEYSWPVVAVRDGDTIAVNILGLPSELNPIGVRIRGIDAPEAGSKARCDAERDRADRATAMLEALLRGGTPVFSSPEWDKFGGRIDATVTVNGANVGQALIEAHLARPYSGQGQRGGWCD